MRTDLELSRKPGSERVVLRLLSRVPRSFGWVRAIVDTGSPITILSAGDVHRLNIAVDGLEQAPPAHGLGRGTLPCQVLDAFKFSVSTREDGPHALAMPARVVNVIALNKMSRDLQESAFQMPTIIGLDMLRLLALRLVVDFSKHEAYLETAG